MQCHHAYFLFSTNHCFTLKPKGDGWSKEFGNLCDAIVHAEGLPGSEGATLTIYNQLGHTIGRMLLSYKNACAPAAGRVSGLPNHFRLLQ